MSYFGTGQFTTSVIFVVTSLLTAANLLVTGVFTLSQQPSGRIVYTESNGVATTTPNLRYTSSSQTVIVQNTSSTGIVFTNATGSAVTSTLVTATTICLTGDLPCKSTWPTSSGGGQGIGWSYSASEDVLRSATPTTPIQVNGTFNVQNVNVSGTFAASSTAALQNYTFVLATGTAVTTTGLYFTTASGTTVNANSATFASITSNNATIGGGTVNNTRIGITSQSDAMFTLTTSTQATSTFFNVVTTARFPADTLINATTVCLSDGTNCPAGVGAQTLAQVTAVTGGQYTTNTISFYNGFLAASSTVTSTFNALTVASYGSATNTFVSAVSTTRLRVGRNAGDGIQFGDSGAGMTLSSNNTFILQNNSGVNILYATPNGLAIWQTPSGYTLTASAGNTTNIGGFDNGTVYPWKDIYASGTVYAYTATGTGAHFDYVTSTKRATFTTVSSTDITISNSFNPTATGTVSLGSILRSFNNGYVSGTLNLYVATGTGIWANYVTSTKLLSFFNATGTNATTSKMFVQDIINFGVSGAIKFNNVTVISVAAGTVTLANIDALDAKTATTTRAEIGAHSRFRMYTATSTWTQPTVDNFTGVRVWCVGGGGGGGGAGTNNTIGGGGSGGGASFEDLTTAEMASSSIQVRVGLAGVAGASGNNDGTNGGTSAFGNFLTCPGGGGGQDGLSAGASGAAGVGSGGDVNGTGGTGQDAGAYTDSYRGYGGAAGANQGWPTTQQDSSANMFGPSGILGHYGGCGSARPPSWSAADYTGGTGCAYGGGGSGGQRVVGSVAGGAGYQGIVVIEELYD